ADDGSVVPEGAVVNSVTVREDGLGVAAVEDADKTRRGWLVFFDADGTGEALGAVRVGAQPDMVTLTPDGSRAVAANEGEPAEDYSRDPVGSISVVALPRRVRAPDQEDVRTAGFRAYEGKRLPRGVRVYGGREDAGTGTPTRPVSENLEPEYITIPGGGRFAFVTVQEANAIAKVDLRRARVVDLFALGTVDRSQVPLDASDDDGSIGIRTWPVRAFRLPDAVASFRVGGRTFLVTADEGDTRDWAGYSEEVRVADLGQDGLPPICPSVAARAGMTVAELQADTALGRLQITTAQGLRADGSCYGRLRAFGSRGISVWTAEGRLVSYSGARFERITARALPDFFNSDHGASAFDDRSDAKGPEPEGVVVGRVGKRPYAFVGLERVGGVMVLDLSRPARPRFVTYVNTRDFAFDGETDLALAGDLGPEGLAFIKRADSPSGSPMLAVAHEVSGTTRLFDIAQLD
ncbi:MAG: choice-of-anchor I family protein, partial [Nocardioides sp.]